MNKQILNDSFDFFIEKTKSGILVWEQRDKERFVCSVHDSHEFACIELEVDEKEKESLLREFFGIKRKTVRNLNMRIEYKFAYGVDLGSKEKNEIDLKLIALYDLITKKSLNETERKLNEIVDFVKKIND